MRFSLAAMTATTTSAAAAAFITILASSTGPTAASDIVVGNSDNNSNAVNVNVAAAVAEPSSSSSEQQHNPRAAATDEANEDIDAGILHHRMLQNVTVPPECKSGYVDCKNGYVNGDPSLSCSAACAGKCCVGEDEDKVCKSFTGKVCKDKSCNGKLACSNAKIPWVVNSCNGSYACGMIAKIGTVGNIINSCRGMRSCFALAYKGKAGDIRSSCRGDQSCNLLAIGNGNTITRQGSVGNVTNSCREMQACMNAGSLNVGGQGPIKSNLNNCCNASNACKDKNEKTLPAECKETDSPTASPTQKPTKDPAASPTLTPTIGPIPPECTSGYVDCKNGYVNGDPFLSCSAACAGECCVGEEENKVCEGFTGKVCKDKSCNGKLACSNAKIPWVVNSCNGGASACRLVASDGGTVGNIINSCGGDRSCFSLAASKGKAGDIRNSCMGQQSCTNVALSSRGSVGSITNSCRAREACFAAGTNVYPGKGIIKSNLNNCCNSWINSCKYKNEKTLPAQCKASDRPTASPSQAPTTMAPAASEIPSSAPTA